jgi:hypothetical protein
MRRMVLLGLLLCCGCTITLIDGTGRMTPEPPVAPNRTAIGDTLGIDMPCIKPKGWGQGDGATPPSIRWLDDMPGAPAKWSGPDPWPLQQDSLPRFLYVPDSIAYVPCGRITLTGGSNPYDAASRRAKAETDRDLRGTFRP